MEEFGKANYQKYRDKILQRDKYQCQNCKKELPTDELDIHHIIPKSNGGPSNNENVQTICKKHHRLLHKESNSLSEYAFEFKHFNNVEKDLDSFAEDLVEPESREEPEKDIEELEDIDIDEIEDLDKHKEINGDF